MIDQLAGSHNLSAILQAVFGDGNGDPIGWGSALGALSQAYSRHPYWLSFAGDVPTGLTIPWLLVLPAVALAVALLANAERGTAGHRRGPDHDALRLGLRCSCPSLGDQFRHREGE